MDATREVLECLRGLRKKLRGMENFKGGSDDAVEQFRMNLEEVRRVMVDVMNEETRSKEELGVTRRQRIQIQEEMKRNVRRMIEETWRDVREMEEVTPGSLEVVTNQLIQQIKRLQNLKKSNITWN